MIDFHMLHRPVKSPFYKKALESVPLTPFLVESTNFSSGRVKGYSLGTSEYVSFCDDDDMVLIDSDYLMSLLDGKDPAIYTNSQILIERTGAIFHLHKEHEWSLADQLSGKIMVHQLTIVRRDVASEAVEFAAHAVRVLGEKDGTSFDLAFNLKVGHLCGWKYHHVDAYLWRKWDTNQMHVSHPTKLPELRKLMKL